MPRQTKHMRHALMSPGHKRGRIGGCILSSAMFVSSLASQRASDVRPTPTTSTHTHQPAGHHIHSFSDWDSNFELHNSTRQGQMGRCKGRNHLTRRRLPWLASMPLLFARRSQPRRPHTTRSWEHIERATNLRSRSCIGCTCTHMNPWEETPLYYNPHVKQTLRTAGHAEGKKRVCEKGDPKRSPDLRRRKISKRPISHISDFVASKSTFVIFRPSLEGERQL